MRGDREDSCKICAKRHEMRAAARISCRFAHILRFWQQFLQCLFKFPIGPITEQDHRDLFQAGGFLDVGDDGAEGDGRRLVEGVAVDAGAERREGDAGYFVLLGEVETGLVGAAEQALVFIGTIIDGADGVEDVFGG